MIEKPLPDTCYTRLAEASPRLLKHHGIIIHHISGALAFPDDPYNVDRIIGEILIPNRYSYHVLIDRDGEPYRLMPEKYQAFHAGYSLLNGKPNCNEYCLGVSLVSTGEYNDEHEPYPCQQYMQLAIVCRQWMRRYKFNHHWIAGHGEVRKAWNRHHTTQREDRNDPSHEFNWSYLFGLLE